MAYNDRALFFKSGCISAALCVLLGTFGAHGLRDKIEPQLLKTWETAVHYQFIHSLALIAVSLSPKSPQLAGYLFLAGNIIFAGSLYAYVLTRIKKFGIITPIGGLAFLFGWIVFAVKGV